MNHSCSPSNVAKNITDLASTFSQESRERVASTIIREKMNNDGIKDGKEFSIKTFGHPARIVYGRPDNKRERKSFNSLTFETVKELQLNLDLSKRGTKKLIQTVRKTSSSNIIESGIYQRLDDAEKCLQEAYDIVVENFEVSGGEDMTNTRNLIVLKDVSDFVMDLINQKNLDPLTATVRVGVDGGGGFFKICVNVFDQNEAEFSSSSSYLDTGVQRVQFLAIVEDVPETYENVKTILEVLRLETLHFNIGEIYQVYNIYDII